MLNFAIVILVLLAVGVNFARAGGLPGAQKVYLISNTAVTCESIVAGACYDFQTCQTEGFKFIAQVNDRAATSFTAVLAPPGLDGFDKPTTGTVDVTIQVNYNQGKFLVAGAPASCDAVGDLNFYSLDFTSCDPTAPEQPEIECSTCTDGAECNLLNAFETTDDGHIKFPLTYTPLVFGCDGGAVIDVTKVTYGYFENLDCNSPICDYIPDGVLNDFVGDICNGKETCDIFGDLKEQLAQDIEDWIDENKPFKRDGQCNIVDLIRNGFSSKLRVEHTCTCPAIVEEDSIDASSSSTASTSNAVVAGGVAASVVGLAAVAALVVKHLKARANPENQALIH
jgi:hypothetical protein